MTLSAQPGRLDRLCATRNFGLVAVVFVCTLWLANLGTPWNRVLGFADWIGAQNARIATNMDRIGLAESRGVQLLNLERPDGPHEWILYHGHPATLDVATSLLFRLTGSRSVLTQRLIPLVAALLGLLFLVLLARRLAIDAWSALAFFLAFPLVGAHGINFSYEPLCVTCMLALVWLHACGWRAGLVPLFFLGGLLDFPVLYLAPYFAVVELWAPRAGTASGSSSSRRFVFGALLGLACVASVAAHLAHVAWSGEPAGNPGQSVFDKIANSFAPKQGFEPTLSEYARAGWRWSVAGFGLPGLVLGVVGVLGLLATGMRRELRVAIFAFVFAGMLHCTAFRAHFVLHDFWPVYFAPAFALGAAHVVGRQDRRFRALLLVAVLLTGLWTSTSIWCERRAPPTRQVAADLAHLFEDADEAVGEGVVAHQMRAPAGWAIENERGKPVYEGEDLVLHLSRIASPDPAIREQGLRGYRGYLDNLGGVRGDLARPQRAFLYGPAADPGDLEVVRSLLSTEPGVERFGPTNTAYRVWSLDGAFLEPARFPAFAAVEPSRRARLALRARLFVVLEDLSDLDPVTWLDGAEGGFEVFRGVRVRSGGTDSLARSAGPSQRTTIVCSAQSEWAAALREAAGAALEERVVQRAGLAHDLLIWPRP